MESGLLGSTAAFRASKNTERFGGENRPLREGDLHRIIYIVVQLLWLMAMAYGQCGQKARLAAFWLMAGMCEEEARAKSMRFWVDFARGLLHVNIHLRERDIQSFLGEGLVNLFVHAEKHGPVVSGVDPGAHGDID